MLTRVHSTDFEATDFNPTVVPLERNLHYDVGRFHSMPDCPYPYLYGADRSETAVSETLLRDLEPDYTGHRLLPRSRMANLKISWIRTQTELTLIDLRTGKCLAAIGQDSWLTTAPQSEYYMTRRWSKAIREWSQEAQGLVWRSFREPDGIAYMFYGDRCTPDVFTTHTHDLPIPVDDRELASGAGHDYVNDLLRSYRIQLS